MAHFLGGHSLVIDPGIMIGFTPRQHKINDTNQFMGDGNNDLLWLLRAQGFGISLPGNSWCYVPHWHIHIKYSGQSHCLCGSCPIFACLPTHCCQNTRLPRTPAGQHRRIVTCRNRLLSGSWDGDSINAGYRLQQVKRTLVRVHGFNHTASILANFSLSCVACLCNSAGMDR